MNILKISTNYQSNISFNAGTKFVIPKDELEYLINEGNTLAEIGNIYDISLYRVRYMVKKYGLKYLREQQHEAIAMQLPGLIAEGKNLQEISQFLGISVNIIGNVINKIIGKEKYLKMLNSVKTMQIDKKLDSMQKDLNPLPHTNSRLILNEALKDISAGAKMQFREAFQKMRQKQKTLAREHIIEDAIAGISRGKPIESVAKELGVPYNYLLRHINPDKYSEAKEAGRKFLRERIKILIFDGEKIQDIAKNLGYSVKTISTILGGSFLSNWKQELNLHRFKMIERLELEGNNLETIAEKLKISTTTVQRIIRAYKKVN